MDVGLLHEELGRPRSSTVTKQRGELSDKLLRLATVIAVSVFVVVYGLIATERVERLPAALVGAGILLAAGVVHSHDAFFSEETGVDWNVIFLLLGMMVIVGVIARTGVFEYIGIKALKMGCGRPLRVMTLLVLFTAIGSALLDNVTTVLLIAPVTLSVCKRLGVNPVPYLLAEVFASNIGGAATLIGDPPNIIIASRADLSFNDFLIHMAPIVIVALAIFVLMLRRLFKEACTTKVDIDVESIDETGVITDKALLVRSVVVFSAVLIAFVLHSVIHTEPAVVALLGAGVLVLISKLRLGDVVQDVEWETLVFFMALFVMVGALVKVGVISDLAESAVDAIDGRVLLAANSLLIVSAILSGIVDNIPYVAAMTPLVGQVVNETAGQTGNDSLWWALALGADFGGNATAVGASANVVMLGVARRAGYPIGFWEFSKKGLVVTGVTVAVCIPYLWLRYFALA